MMLRAFTKKDSEARIGSRFVEETENPSPFQNEITLANPTLFIINLRLHDLPPSDECPFSMLRTRAAFGICLAQTQIADPLFLVLCHFAFAF